MEKDIYKRLDEKYKNRESIENDNPVDLSEFTTEEIDLLIEREIKLMQKD
ncbi:hypothetical protein [Peptoniphilus sp.]